VIRDPGWEKTRIRDKHPGSATLQLCSRTQWWLQIWHFCRILERWLTCNLSCQDSPPPPPSWTSTHLPKPPTANTTYRRPTWNSSTQACTVCIYAM
jgi:hypothetical protein